MHRGDLALAHRLSEVPQLLADQIIGLTGPVTEVRVSAYSGLRHHAPDSIWTQYHTVAVNWAVEMADEFKPEFGALHEDIRTEILALSLVLTEFGPQLGRPRVDTLEGSHHANMKQLRFGAANGEWPSLLIPGAGRFCLWRETNLAGAKKRFYRELIRKADDRFEAHLARIGREK